MTFVMVMTMDVPDIDAALAAAQVIESDCRYRGLDCAVTSVRAYEDATAAMIEFPLDDSDYANQAIALQALDEIDPDDPHTARPVIR